MSRTKLSDRTLWFDGTCEVDASQVPSLLLRGVEPGKIAATSGDLGEVERFNRISEEPIATSKTENLPLDHSWKLPPEVASIDLGPIVTERLERYLLRINQTDPNEIDRYHDRLKAELSFMSSRGLMNFVRSLYHVTQTFRKNSIVWGVGRGSSCASLVLFLIEVHLIDPVKYDIPFNEFFHD